MRILRKRPRESTALEEYIILEPKNFFQLQKLMKLWRAPIGEKREHFFYRNMLDPLWSLISDSPDLTELVMYRLTARAGLWGGAASHQYSTVE